MLGAGSWGTAFGKVLADAGCDVALWARRTEVAQAIRGSRRNPDYLPDVTLPDRLTATADAGEALAGADLHNTIFSPDAPLPEAWGADDPAPDDAPTDEAAADG